MKKTITIYLLLAAAFLTGNALPVFAGNENLQAIGYDAGWSTYYGGSAEDVVTDMIVVGEFVFFTGYTKSTTGISSPTTYQQTKSDGYDAFVVKFDINGKKVWGTYIGGNGDDYATSITYDTELQAIIIAGYTSSQAGFDVSNSYHKEFGGGDYDAFVSIINQNGKRVWSTYIGGNGNDYAYDVKSFDRKILIAGKTGSHNRIADGDKKFKENLTGNSDGMLVLYNLKDYKIEWATYFGGSGDDEIRSVDFRGDIYITGSTNSTDGINHYSNSNYNGGLTDAFVAKFEDKGEITWSRYFGGNGEDKSLTVSFDGTALAIAGETNSTNNIAFKTPYQATPGGMKDGFFAQFIPDGVLQSSSYFGGSGDDKINKISLSGARLFIAGNTTSTDGIATNNAPYNEYKNGIDAFIGVINNFNLRDWCTYIGGSGNDEALAVSFIVDNNEAMYLAGSTSSGDFRITPLTAHQKVYGEMGDGFLMKFVHSPEKLTLKFDKTRLCSDGIYEVNYKAEGFTNLKDEFIFVELSDKYGNFDKPVIIGKKEAKPSDIIEIKIPANAEIGTAYRIRLSMSEPKKIISMDNGSNITIIPRPVPPVIQGDKTACRGTEKIYSVPLNNELEYEWDVKAGLIKDGQNTHQVRVLWQNTGTGSIGLKVISKASDCQGVAERIPVQVDEAPEVSLESFNPICKNAEPIELKGGKPAGGIYMAGGKIITVFDPKLYPVGNHTIKYVYPKNSAECQGWDEKTIEVLPPPDKPVITGFADRLVSSAEDGNLWYFKGAPLQDEKGKIIYPKSNGVYQVKVISINGCESELSEPFPFEGQGPEIEINPEAVKFETVYCNDEFRMREIKITNSGNSVLVLSSYTISGTGKEDFEFSGFEKKELKAKESINAKIYFKPKTIGQKTAELIITSTGKNSPPIIPLNGAKENISFEFSQNSLEFTDLEPDTPYEKSVLLTNNSPLDLVFNSNYLKLKDFEVITNGSPEIPAGKGVLLRVKFKGGAAGKEFNESLEMTDSKCGNTIKLSLIAKVKGTAVRKFDIKIGSVNATSGQYVEIPIQLNEPGALMQKGITSIKGTLNFNTTLLEPVEDTPKGDKDKDGKIRIIPIQFDIHEGTGTGLQTQKTLKFRVSLGNDSMTTIRFDKIEAVPNLPDIEFTSTGGLVKLTDICNAGGPRLVYFDGEEIALTIMTNIANDNISLSFNLLENGHTKITIFNSSGYISKNVLNDNISKGFYEQDISVADLGTGLYFIVLETPTAYITKRIAIIK